MSLAITQNLGLFKAVIKGPNAPKYKWVVWAKEVNPLNPNEFVLHVWNYQTLQWEPLTAFANTWLKFEYTYEDLQVAQASVIKTVQTVLANYIVEKVFMNVSEAFAGAGITDLKFKLGISGDDNKYLVSGEYDGLQTVDGTQHTVENLGVIESTINSTPIILTATAVGANLDQLTAGKLVVSFKMSIYQ